MRFASTTKGAPPEGVGRFCRNGYGILPSFLQPHEIPQFAGWVEEVLARPAHPGMNRPGNDLAPLRWNNPIIAEALRSERRLHMLERLLPPRGLKWISGYVSTKRPHTPALWWHQDWWCWDHPISFQAASPQVALLCYLTDTDARSGALRVLPGSHHRTMPIHAHLPEPHGSAADELSADHRALADLDGQITLSVSAGDAVVIDYRLLHGTHGNGAAARRDCILLSFVPAWGMLPAELRGHLIAHPALPTPAETQARAVCGYGALLPAFDGAAADLRINRMPPAEFRVYTCTE